jgi:hypothetical protein
MNDLATAPSKALAGVPMPRIGAPLADGIFAGIVRGADADHALVLLQEAPKRMKWKDATEWAAGLGATLPNRSEQAVLFGNLKDQFKDGGWYWSCEQYAGYESSAWCQGFTSGDQYGSRKDDELRARAVRRLPLVI